MDKFLQLMERYFLPIATKVGGQRHFYGYFSQTNFLFFGGFGADGDAADNHGGWFDDFWEFEREF